MSHLFDLLAIGAHPDDVEISAGGTLLKLAKEGKRIAIVDLTQGELGSRGSGELRLIEAEEARKRLGVEARENLYMADGFFQHDEENLRKLIVAIRKYRPRVVFGNAPFDRHPDHGRGSKLVNDACFLAGLRKIETECDGVSQEAWRPKSLFFYNQDFYNKPDFVVDISGFWEQKIEILKSFGSQFYDPNSQEPKTPISGEEFFDFLHSRAMEFGRPAGYLLAEGFITSRIPGVTDIFSLD